MSDLFRPKIVEYRLAGKSRTPEGQRVTKDTPGAVRTERRSKKWYGRIAGQEKPVPLSESKETARRMLNKQRGDAELANVGLVDPFADHKMRPLAEHVEDFRRYLTAKGNCPEHVAKTSSQVRAIIEGCRFKVPGDVQPSAVVEFLAGLRGASGGDLDPRKEWWAVEEVAGLCGISPDSVRRMIRRGCWPRRLNPRNQHGPAASRGPAPSASAGAAAARRWPICSLCEAEVSASRRATTTSPQSERSRSGS
ncbi:MAG TPA: hypothetical protein VEL76_29985 [Gemmataceae bacterium]|nr:hypothetical protein [Gemmataceae bacterium]